MRHELWKEHSLIFMSMDIHENTPVLKRVVYQRRKLAECLAEGFHSAYKEVDSKVTKPRTEAATQPQPTVSCCACYTEAHCPGLLSQEKWYYIDEVFYSLKTIASVPKSCFSAPCVPLSHQTPSYSQACNSFFLFQAGFYSLFRGQPSCWPIRSLPRTLLFIFMVSKVPRLKKVKCEHTGATVVREINHKHRCVEENQRYISIINGNKARDKEFDPHKSLHMQCLDLSTIFTETDSCSK